MIYITTAPTTSPCSILLQQLLRLHDLSCYRNYYVFRIYMVTATITPYDLHRYSNYYIFSLYIVTAPITSSWSTVTTTTISLWSILFQQPSHLYALYCHSHSYDLMIYIIPATKSPSRPIVLQPICYIPTTNVTASILRLNNPMLRPIYYALVIECYSLHIMLLQSNDTAYISRPYNLMLQPIYYVLTTQCYSLPITSLQVKVTAYILCPYNLMVQPI